MAAPEMAQIYVTHSVSSLYNFNVAAAEKILKSLEAVVPPNVAYEVQDGDDGQSFSMICPEDDNTSFPMLCKLIMGFIEVKSDKVPDSHEDIKVTRLIGTTRIENILSPTEIERQSLMLANTVQKLPPLRLGFPGSLGKSTIRGPSIAQHGTMRLWGLSGTGRVNMHDSGTLEIASDGHCRVEGPQWSIPDSRFEKNDERAIGRGMSKCAITDQAATKEASIPRNASFLIAEGEAYFMLKLTTLRELVEFGDIRGSTTLLSHDSHLLASGQDSLVLSMINGNRIFVIESRRQQSISEPTLWKDHPFKSLNTQTPQGQDLATLIGPGAATRTIKWIAHVADPTEMGNPYLPPDEKDTLKPAQGDLASGEADEPTGAPDKTAEFIDKNTGNKLKRPESKRTRAIKGERVNVEPAKQEPIVASGDNGPSDQQVAMRQKDELLIDFTQDDEVSTREEKQPFSSAEPLIDFAEGDKLSTRQEKQTFLPEGPLIDLTADYMVSIAQKKQASDDKEPLIDLGEDYKVSTGKAKQDVADGGLLGMATEKSTIPEITAPYMPPHLRAPGPSAPGWQGKTAGAKVGRLVDASEPQEASRISTKAQPRHTMNQKAPSQASLRANTGLVKDLEACVKNFLLLALPSKGSVLLEIGIGRLLINHQVGPSQFKKRSFQLSEWITAFPVQSGTTGLETTFTPRLTTSAQDGESILESRLPKGSRIFESNTAKHPVSRTVSYIVSCKSIQGDKITIIIDEEGSFRFMGDEILIGSIAMHFPKRAWDARLSLKITSPPYTGYQKQVEGIVENMRIFTWPNGTTLNFSTQVIDEELTIESIMVRRETVHPSKSYADLLLHLCEVQDLKARREGNHYHGTIEDLKPMIDAGRYWWEASITSVNATSVLEKNDKLELEDLAKCNAGTIIEKGIIRDLYFLTNELVTRIDHVGSQNKGLKDSLGPRTNTRVMKPVDESPLAAYW